MMYDFCSHMVCSTNLPSGNQVDGLPLAASTRAEGQACQAARNIPVTNGRFFLDFLRFLCQIAAPLGGQRSFICFLLYMQTGVSIHWLSAEHHKRELRELEFA